MAQPLREIPDALALEQRQLGHRHANAPLSGCYPFSGVGDPIVLWDAMARLTDERGESAARPVRIEASWSSDARITWTTDLKDADWTEAHLWGPPASDSQALILAAEGNDTLRLQAFVRGLGDGWSNGATFGGTRPLCRVLVHWINLPDFARGDWLVRASDEHQWIGRTELRADGWILRFDSRPDLREVYDELKRRRTFAITHVMELRRDDGSAFSAEVAEQTLAGLQFAISYALGRNSCPSLPVGFSTDGHASWTSWQPLHADHPALGSQAWWPDHAVKDLEQYLNAFFAKWRDPAQRDQLQFLASWATAASDGTYIESRTTLAISALEHLSWIEEVLEGEVNEADWRERDAVKRMRALLQRAHVNLAIHPDMTPALAKFASFHRLADGPKAILKVRDRLIHPKDAAGLYAETNLIAETSRLACRYLDLTLLHWIGYRGHIKNRTRVRGFAREAERVPWVRS